MLTTYVLLNIAAIPLPERSRLISEMVWPSFVSIAVTRPSVNLCMRNICGFVTTCSSARSMSCFQRNSSSVPRSVLDAIPLVLNVATLYI